MGVLYSSNKKIVNDTNDSEIAIDFENGDEDENEDKNEALFVKETTANKINQPNFEETQYINYIKNILKNGYDENSLRNGKYRYIFGEQPMRFSLENGKLPLLTTKRIEWKKCVEEILYFIEDNPNIYSLMKEDKHVWDINTTPKYSEIYNVNTYTHKDVEPYASNQYISYDKPKLNGFGPGGVGVGCNKFYFEEYTNTLVEQLNKNIEILKDPELRMSKRIFITSLIHKISCGNNELYPYMILCQFFVSDGDKLSCAFHQRSSDSVTGKPFNIATYDILTHLLANHCWLKARTVT